MLDQNNEDANIANRECGGENAHRSCGDYVERARAAAAAGDSSLAMHLYLIAFEEAYRCAPSADEFAISALREAWKLSCDLKERSLAEYIFDKLEPYLSSEEVPEYAKRLQSLALDKLSEFGISRSDLEGMADMISEEIGQNAHITGISPIMSLNIGGNEGKDDASKSEVAPATAPADVKTAKPSKSPSRVCYDDLVGFDSVIDDARALGLGVKDDDEYRLLLDTLRERHGLDGLSAAGSVVFRTSSREDANAFMEAVVGELDLPAMRIQMQPGPMGVPMLCVTVSAKNQPRMLGRVSLEAPSVLVLEDVDLWGAPLIDAASSVDGEGVMFANMSRAAREAVALVSAAVANPDVYVLASVGGDSADQGYLYDLMEPMSVIDIYLPDEVERRNIWNRMALEHPSIRELDLSTLTRVSRNLSRTDIVTAAREAVEDAYRAGLKARCYRPVTQELMFEHISNFQPLDSSEYRTLEDAVASDFRNQIDEIEKEFEQQATEEHRRYDALGDDAEGGR